MNKKIHVAWLITHFQFAGVPLELIPFQTNFSKKNYIRSKGSNERFCFTVLRAC